MDTKTREAVAIERIGHFDADAFFASVEQAADRQLRGKPVAVGGGRRGVVSSASYEARAYGIHSAMPVQQALRLCPSLTIVPGRFALYEQFSAQIFGYLEALSPYVERSSIDEGYIADTGARVGLIGQLRGFERYVRECLKIGVSCGVARGKRISKIAGAVHKPHGFVVVPTGSEAAFLRPLPVGMLPGVGAVRLAQLQGMGVRQIGDLLRMGRPRLVPVLGKAALEWLALARGEDDSRVAIEQAPAQSHGAQHSFEVDAGEREQVERVALGLLEGVLRTVRAQGKAARALVMSIRYSDGVDAQSQLQLPEPDNIADVFIGPLRKLLGNLWTRRVRLRQVRVQVSKLYPAVLQGDLFEQAARQRRRDLARTVDEIAQRYGTASVLRAVQLPRGSQSLNNSAQRH